jgi:hypothetical protein
MVMMARRVRGGGVEIIVSGYDTYIGYIGYIEYMVADERKD